MFVHSRRRNRRGVTAIEYGILAALIIVALLGILRVTGNDLAGVFGRVGSTIENATNAGAASSAPVFTTFNHFVAGTNSFCSPGNYFSGFKSGANSVISTDRCYSLLNNVQTQTESYNDISGTYPYIVVSAPAAQATTSGASTITVPPLQGAGTGFSIPNVGYVNLYKYDPTVGIGGSSPNFTLQSSNGDLTVSNTKSAAAACAKIGGTFHYGAIRSECTNGSFYTGAELAAALPTQ